MIRDTFQTFYECRSHILRPSTALKGMVVNDDAQRIGHRMMVSGVEISMNFCFFDKKFIFHLSFDQRNILDFIRT